MTVALGVVFLRRDNGARISLLAGSFTDTNNLLNTNFAHCVGSFCNGGTVEELIDKYYALNTPVPEHFIWYGNHKDQLQRIWSTDE